MARRKKGLPLHGWVLIDKPVGMSSSQVVGKVRWLLNAQKAGHGGTLDPLASGLLPIALGEATKTVSYALDGTKTYQFVVQWGRQTTTDDLEGETLAESDVRPSKDQIEAVLDQFRGEITQVPPIFSAIKINGQRAYDLARSHDFLSGKPAFDMPTRDLTIFKLELLEIIDENHARFEVRCSKGTYVRALARDIGLALGTRAFVTVLHRTHAGPFSLESSFPLDAQTDLEYATTLKQGILPVAAALDDIPSLQLTQTEALRLKNGQKLNLLKENTPERLAQLQKIASEQPIEVIAFHLQTPVAIAQLDQNRLAAIRVLNLLDIGDKDVDHC